MPFQSLFRNLLSASTLFPFFLYKNAHQYFRPQKGQSHLSNWYENKDSLGELLKEERESNRGVSFKMWLCSPESHQVIEIWRMVGKGPLIMNSLRSTGKHRPKQTEALWKLKISRCRKVLQTSKRTAKSYSCLIWLTAFSSHTVSLISYPSLIENYTSYQSIR